MERRRLVKLRVVDPLAKLHVAVRADKLVEAIKSVLLTAIKAGGSSLRDYRQPSGELGYFQNSFQVYGKQGLACPNCYCDFERTGGIKRVVQNGRSTFYCSRVQG